MTKKKDLWNVLDQFYNDGKKKLLIDENSSTILETQKL